MHGRLRPHEGPGAQVLVDGVAGGGCPGLPPPPAWEGRGAAPVDARGAPAASRRRPGRSRGAPVLGRVPPGAPRPAGGGLRLTRASSSGALASWARRHHGPGRRPPPETLPPRAAARGGLPPADPPRLAGGVPEARGDWRPATVRRVGGHRLRARHVPRPRPARLPRPPGPSRGRGGPCPGRAGPHRFPVRRNPVILLPKPRKNQ